MQTEAFSHPNTAAHEDAMAEIRELYGPTGYAAYFMLLEAIHATGPLRKAAMRPLALDFGIRTLPSIIASLVEAGLLVEDGERIDSTLLRYQRSVAQTKAEKASRSARARWDKVIPSPAAAPGPVHDVRPVFQVFKSAFQQKKPGGWPNQDKELKALVELSRLVDTPEAATSMVERFWSLRTTSEKDFWKGQPFYPSRLLSLWGDVEAQAQVGAKAYSADWMRREV